MVQVNDGGVVHGWLFRKLQESGSDVQHCSRREGVTVVVQRVQEYLNRAIRAGGGIVQRVAHLTNWRCQQVSGVGASDVEEAIQHQPDDSNNHFILNLYFQFIDIPTSCFLHQSTVIFHQTDHRNRSPVRIC